VALQIPSAEELVELLYHYDASSGFYTYEIDWYPDRPTWWMIQPVTG
jgi:hypothetical protein